MNTENNAGENMSLGNKGKRSMITTIIGVAVIAIIAVVGVRALMGGTISNAYTNPGVMQTAPANPTTITSPNTTMPVPTQTTSNEVVINNFAFNPGSLTVPAGTTMTWVNNDSVTHSIKSDTFSSPDLAPGDTYQHTFTTAGTYNYTCSIHPSMMGQIIVQ